MAIKTPEYNYLFNKISSLKVSIIIPARNEEKTLSFLLSSIQSQSVKPYEVILVNDQSEDNTESIGRTIRGKDHQYRFFAGRLAGEKLGMPQWGR